MSRLPISPALLNVLHAIERGAPYGFEVIERTGLPSGTVYPALSRLEEDGFVASRWEDHKIAQQEKRPARRYYELTPAGARALRAGLIAMTERERELDRRRVRLGLVRARG